MDYRRYITMLSLLILAVAAKGQVDENKSRIQVPDSVKFATPHSDQRSENATPHSDQRSENATPHSDQRSENDFEEWLRNEPLQPSQNDSMTISPIPPSIPVDDPMKLNPKHPPISINIMTPQLRTEMQLAYQSRWLENQRKDQVGGAMTIGINPLNLLGYLLYKLFPDRKSKKQREREKLQRILDNY